MWVARDADNALHLFEHYPERYIYGHPNYADCSYWRDKKIPEYVTAGKQDYLSILDPTLFPNLSWNDEPIEVELIAKNGK